MSDEVIPKKRAKLLDLETVERHAECPICFEIPRDGVMLTCRNSHNVCATCKERMGEDAKCPQGQCDFDDPPRMNRTVADLVENLPFDFPCKFANPGGVDATGCGFKGTKATLKLHEDSCEHRPVPCPIYPCKQLVSANKVVEHCQTDHRIPLDEGAKSPIAERLLWRLCWTNTTKSWAKVHGTAAGRMFSFVHYECGLFYAWMVALADADTLRGRISFGNAKPSQLIAWRTFNEAEMHRDKLFAGNADHSMFTTPVYPIDWTREKIMKDPRCLRLREWSVSQIMNEPLTEYEKRDGFDRVFKVVYNVIKCDV